jgi:hypothetical protein
MTQKVQLFLFGTGLVLTSLALPSLASAAEEQPGGLDKSKSESRQTIEEQEAVLQKYIAQRTFNARYGYASTEGRKRFKMSDYKGAFGQTFKGDNGEAVVIQLGQINAQVTDENQAFFNNNLAVARLLDEETPESISISELSDKLDGLVSKGLIASQPDYGYSLAVVYKNKAGQRVQGFIRIDQLPEADTRFFLDGGGSINNGIDAGVGIRKTTVLDRTETSFKEIYKAFRLGLNDSGFNVSADMGTTRSWVANDKVRTESWGAGVTFSNGVSVGGTFRSLSVDQYTGEERKHFASIGINPGGPSIAAKGDINDRISYLAGVNALPILGGSVPVPGVVVAGLSFKGKPTTWTYNSRHFWYTSSSGNDGKTLVSLGVAGIGGTFIPWILPGDGLYPDRLVEMPAPIKDQERVNNIALEVREVQMAFRNNREALAFVQKRMKGFDGVELFPGKAALWVIPDSQWHGGEFPRVAAAFSEITGVEAMKDGKAIISDDDAFEVMFKWFSEKNSSFVGTFKTPQEVEALKLYLRTHTKLDTLPTPKEAIDMGATTRLYNINTNVFEVDGAVQSKKSRIVTAANGQQTLAMPAYVTVKVYEGERDSETHEEAKSSTMTFVYNGSTTLDPNVPVGKQRQLLKTALEQGTFDKDGNLVSYGASHVRVMADSILTNANVGNGPSTKYQAVKAASEQVKAEVTKMPGWVLLPEGVTVQQYFGNTVDAYEQSQTQQQPSEPAVEQGEKGEAPQAEASTVDESTPEVVAPPAEVPEVVVPPVEADSVQTPPVEADTGNIAVPETEITSQPVEAVSTADTTNEVNVVTTSVEIPEVQTPSVDDVPVIEEVK